MPSRRETTQRADRTESCFLITTSVGRALSNWVPRVNSILNFRSTYEELAAGGLDRAQRRFVGLVGVVEGRVSETSEKKRLNDLRLLGQPLFGPAGLLRGQDVLDAFEADEPHFQLNLLVFPTPFPRSAPQGTPEVLPYSFLRRMSSPSQSRTALRRTAGPLGRGVLGAPQALWARRGRRAGGAKRPFAFPIRSLPSPCYVVLKTSRWWSQVTSTASWYRSDTAPARCEDASLPPLPEDNHHLPRRTRSFSLR